MVQTQAEGKKRGKGAARSARTGKFATVRGKTPVVKGPGVVVAGFTRQFIKKGGVVDVEEVAETFRMTKTQLANTTGLGVATLTKADRRKSPKAQRRVTEMLEIISRVRDWVGGEAQAMAWYRSQPIPALNGRTPEALVKSGKANAVRDYLDHLALGGFA